MMLVEIVYETRAGNRYEMCYPCPWVAPAGRYYEVLALLGENGYVTKLCSLKMSPTRDNPRRVQDIKGMLNES